MRKWKDEEVTPVESKEEGNLMRKDDDDEKGKSDETVSVWVTQFSQLKIWEKLLKKKKWVKTY